MSIFTLFVCRHFALVFLFSFSPLFSQNEPLFMRTYDEADGEGGEDATLRLHNIVHSSLDVVGERKGEPLTGVLFLSFIPVFLLSQR